jgi:hypothetical protein
MITHEHAGLDLGQDTTTSSYASVVIADRTSGMAIPGVAASAKYNFLNYGANSDNNGQALILLNAPAGTNVPVTLNYPGYNPVVVQVLTSADPNVPPTPVVMDKGAAAKPIMPTMPAGTQPKALISSPLPNWWIYVGLGAVGLIGLIVIVAINKK